MPQQSTEIAGRLVDASTGAPIEAAVVAIPALDLSTLSDASGAFRLARIPAGAHTFEIRHIAYGTRISEVRVRGGGPLSLALRLEPIVLDVDPLEVEVEWRPAYLEQVGFYDRKAKGIGEFYDPAFVQRWGVGAWAAAPNLIREIILARGRGGGSLARRISAGHHRWPSGSERPHHHAVGVQPGHAVLLEARSPVPHIIMVDYGAFARALGLESG